jgi:transposase, IS5 family
MPEQLTSATQADGGFEAHRKTTRRDVFLAEMDKVGPWAQLFAVIEPFYPKARVEGGSRLVGLERMLRIHFLQHRFGLIIDPHRVTEEQLRDAMPRISERLLEEFQVAKRGLKADVDAGEGDI